MQILDTKLSPIQVEVLGSAFESICEEMGETLIRTSFSPNVKERRDCTTGLFDANGNTLAQPEHIPIHLGSLMGIVREIIDTYDLSQIKEGDTFFGNDAYLGGGTHLNDIVLVTPIFIDGQIHAWATNLAHHNDFAERGHAHIFQEGLRIPPLKFAENWEYLPNIMAFVLTNMQVPDERIADFNAQMAANRLGVQRYTEICAKYGADVIAQAGRDLMTYTERKMRIAISEVPDGVYKFTDVFDTTQLGYEPLEFSVEMLVRDTDLYFSFEAPKQVEAGLNVVRTALLATVYYAVKSVIGHDIPSNSGMYRPIHVDAPLGSIINCTPPAAVYARTMACQRVVDLIHGAFAQILPDQVHAASYGSVSSMCITGVDPRTGKYYIYNESVGGGLGASATSDGLDGAQAHVTNSANQPVESLEYEYPLTVTRYELVDGSAGPGKFRGGMGIRREIRVDHDDAKAELETCRYSSTPWGLFGGENGQKSWMEKNHTELATATTKLAQGDVVAMITAGGGGYGSPSHRSPAAVAQDVLEERLLPEVARLSYAADSPKDR